MFSDTVGAYHQAGDGALTGCEIARLMGKPHVPLPAPLVGGVLWVLRRLGITDHGPEGVAPIRARRVSPLGV